MVKRVNLACGHLSRWCYSGLISVVYHTADLTVPLTSTVNVTQVYVLALSWKGTGVESQNTEWNPF